MLETAAKPGMAEAPLEGDMALSASVYGKISSVMYERFGIDLRSGKQELIRSRLTKHLRRTGCRDFAEYYALVDGDATGRALMAMADALTTNYTSFMRERAHFDFLAEKILPELAVRPRIEIWSAAAATGEEIYSIAFTAIEALQRDGTEWRDPNRLRILGTDVSDRALEQAGKAVYKTEALKTLPEGWANRYFLRGVGGQAGFCRVKPEIRRLVRFERHNLMEPPKDSWTFPLIFCRNVMIYFDKQTRQAVIGRLASRLEPGGYLLIGHAETLTGFDHQFKFVQPAIYRKTR